MLLAIKQCGSFQAASAPPLLISKPPLSGIQSPSCRQKNSVNAYTTKQITLTIFYTTSSAAKPLPKGLNLANLFVYFWNHYKAVVPHREPKPHKLQPHIQDWSNKPLGHGLLRKAWAQLNRLCTGIRKFSDSMVKWGFGDDSICHCEKPQTAYHIINDCKSIGSPCNLTDVVNPMLMRYLINCHFS